MKNKHLYASYVNQYSSLSLFVLPNLLYPSRPTNVCGFALIYIEDQLLCVYGIIKCITYIWMWLMLCGAFSAETIMNI